MVDRPVASYRTNLVLSLLSGWFTIGLLLDAWAHNNVPELESFFTPWHAVFYWGFVATAGWLAWTVRAALRPGQRSLRCIPRGYGPAVVAVPGFAVAGAGDLTWHTAFGIEQSIDILFSPTHLGLLVAMFAIVTTPVRAMWADRRVPTCPGLVRLLPVVLSVAWASTLVLLFLQYANALVYDAGNVALALATFDEGHTASFVSSVAVTNVVIMVPLLTLLRRWRPPLGTATILYLVLGLLSTAVSGFGNWPLVVGFVAMGVLVDVVGRWLRPAAEKPWHVRAYGFVAPLVTWAGFLTVAAQLSPPFAPDTFTGLPPEGVVELYTGIPVVQALAGVLLALLLVPTKKPAEADIAHAAEPALASGQTNASST